MTKKTQSTSRPNSRELSALADLFNDKRYSDAEICARKLIHRFPEHGFAWKVLGAVLVSQGRTADAVEPMRHAISRSPHDHESHINLGNTLQSLGHFEEATDCYRRALEIKPDMAETHNNLGNVLKKIGRFEDAADCYRRVLEIKPGTAATHNNLGSVLQSLGRFEDAADCYRSALEIKPDLVEAHNNLGNILKDTGRFKEAEGSYRRALEIKPDMVEAHNNLGNLLKDTGRFEEAEDSYRRALQIKPGHVETLNNLGVTLRRFGRLDEAVACYRQVLATQPDHAKAYSNLLFCLSHDYKMAPSNSFVEHRSFGDYFENPYKDLWGNYANVRSDNRRINIGFVSGDLYRHAVAHFIKPILGFLNKERFNVFVYYNNHFEDSITNELKHAIDNWYNVFWIDDQLFANRVREDKIDILIDLSGHTARNRLPVFARKPAPIQVTWIGYPNTTGLTAMDYVISDRNLAPHGLYEQYWTEKFVRLPSAVTFFAG